jgi:hypothetical protein
MNYLFLNLRIKMEIQVLCTATSSIKTMNATDRKNHKEYINSKNQDINNVTE